ncbi:MAG: pentapeptide repeat-containing protein, partial [Nostoc sp.]
MNISDSELDLVSLASRIEQIEEEQNLRKQNIAWLKRYFDEIKQEFNNRTELQQIQSMQEALAHLTAQVADLQQHLNLSSNLSNGLNNNHTIDASIKETIIDDTEIVKQFVESVEKPEKQLACVDVIAISENIDIAETEPDEPINVAEEQPQLERAFSAQEFQIERIMWLVNRIYAGEEPSHEIPVDVEEFLRRYDGGQRDFTGINLAEVNLSGTSLSIEVNLSQANLSGANLCSVRWESLNLSGANLRGAKLCEARLCGTKKSS